MFEREHYLIERNAEGKFTVKAAADEQPCAKFDRQLDAVTFAKRLNPFDQPDVARIRYADRGKSKWRRWAS